MYGKSNADMAHLEGGNTSSVVRIFSDVLPTFDIGHKV